MGRLSDEERLLVDQHIAEQGVTRKKAKVAPPGCELPEVKPTTSIRGVPDARTVEGKVASLPDPDPQRTALSARARRAGLDNDRHGRKAAAVPYMGFDEGLCIHAIHGDAGTARLWNVWQGLCMTEDAYAYHYLGSRRRATGMKLQLIRERVETADFHRDTRTADEKSRDAANRWATWQGHLGRIDAAHRSMLKAVYWQETGGLWTARQGIVQGPTPMHEAGLDQMTYAGWPTDAGRRFVAAVEALADAVEEKRRSSLQTTQP